MAKAKKKLLPKDFGERLGRDGLAELQAVFDTCELDARGGYAKATALAFADCPEDFARWLVAQGADLEAADDRGHTPLHIHARTWHGRLVGVLIELGSDVGSAAASIGTPLHAAADSHKTENARRLLAAGADAEAVNKEGLTPLALALRGCSNADLEAMAPLAEALLAAGARRTPEMTRWVEQIGNRFEFHRANFDPASVDAASAALDRLCAMFDAASAPRRVMHDVAVPIVVPSGTWQEQHQALWERLVPSAGAAATVQGEVIRIAGRIVDELERNGGVNWDADFKRMADAFLAHVGSGRALPAADLAEAAGVVAAVKRRSGEARELARWAVSWVLANPVPTALPRPEYER